MFNLRGVGSANVNKTLTHGMGYFISSHYTECPHHRCHTSFNNKLLILLGMHCGLLDLCLPSPCFFECNVSLCLKCSGSVHELAKPTYLHTTVYIEKTTQPSPRRRYYKVRKIYIGSKVKNSTQISAKKTSIAC